MKVYFFVAMVSAIVSTSAFAMYVRNNPIRYVDPDGRKAAPAEGGTGFSGYSSPQEAAEAFGEALLPTSLQTSTEIGGNIIQDPNGTYAVTDVVTGRNGYGVTIPARDEYSSCPSDTSGHRIASQVHTHTDRLVGYFYSPSDMGFGSAYGSQYLVTPYGNVRRYDPNSER